MAMEVLFGYASGYSKLLQKISWNLQISGGFCTQEKLTKFHLRQQSRSDSSSDANEIQLYGGRENIGAIRSENGCATEDPYQ